jgi:hypothetical protein
MERETCHNCYEHDRPEAPSTDEVEPDNPGKNFTGLQDLASEHGVSERTPEHAAAVEPLARSPRLTRIPGVLD